MMRMAKVVVPVAAALVVAAGGVGCGSESTSALQARKLPSNVRADVDSVAAANTRFALDLYRAMRSHGGGTPGNLIVSPFSISTAFAMVHAGAREETEAQMARVFHFSLAPERLHPAFGALLRSLEAGAEFDGYRLDLANRGAVYPERGPELPDRPPLPVPHPGQGDREPPLPGPGDRPLGLDRPDPRASRPET